MKTQIVSGLMALLPAVLPGMLPAVLPGAASAQEGTIAYRHSAKIDLEISEEQRARIEARGGPDAIPTERVSEVVLLFNASESLMKPVPPAPREARGRRGDAGARQARAGAFMNRMRMGSAAREARETLVEAHVRYGEGTIIESRDFLGRRFLIEEDRTAFEWKLTSEQAEFLGYVVYKAVADHEGEAVEAWFTPQIPVGAGPASYGGLPGMILVVSVNEGHTQYTATEVSLGAVAEGVIVRPTEGEAVSREEYEEIVAEKLEEIRRTRGGQE